MCYCNNFELACLTVHSDNGLLAQEKQGHGVVHKTPFAVMDSSYKDWHQIGSDSIAFVTDLKSSWFLALPRSRLFIISRQSWTTIPPSAAPSPLQGCNMLIDMCACLPMILGHI